MTSPRRTVRRVFTAAVASFALATSVGVPLASTTADAATAKPATPTGLPAGMESLTSFVPAASCTPIAKPGALKLAKLLLATYPGTSYGISRTCGVDPLPTTEHYEGRAVDWMVSVRKPTQAAQAASAIQWLLATDSAGNKYANARRLGVMYLIWNNKIWSSYRSSEGWRAYSTCAQRTEPTWDSTCHRNHIHISLSWEGAMGRTSFWTRQVAAPDYGPCRAADLNWAGAYTRPNPTRCAVYPRVLAPKGASTTLQTLTTFSGMSLSSGSTGPVVRALQTALGLQPDGWYGPRTTAAVKAWQQSRSIKATGVVNATTWRALLASLAPKPAPRQVPLPAPTPTPAPAPAPAPAPTKPVTNPLTQYKNVVLRLNSRGPAVKAMQKRLRITADGWFGPQTERAVRSFQRSHRLPVTGVVASMTWRALGA
jgi:peptidoglycan hydrolase-like protein with peptidoglycan-binding domain